MAFTGVAARGFVWGCDVHSDGRPHHASFPCPSSPTSRCQRLRYHLGDHMMHLGLLGYGDMTVICQSVHIYYLHPQKNVTIVCVSIKVVQV
jgi:hypothetical protein